MAAVGMIVIPSSLGILNGVLNGLYQRLLEPVRSNLILPTMKTWFGGFIETSTKTKVTDEQILEATRAPLPFVGLVGVVLITVGFILALL